MNSAEYPAGWDWLLRRFQQTRWSLLRRLRAVSGEDRKPDAEVLCRAYWYPLYCFLRSSGYAVEDAQDCVQSFLSTVVTGDQLSRADPQRGRFRNFLITLLQRHASALQKKGAAKKRGGGVVKVSLDAAALESAWQQDRADGAPDEVFRRALAVQLVNQGIAALRAHYAHRAPALINDLLPAIEGPLPDDSYAAIGSRHGLTASAVAVAASRMRLRFEAEVRKSAAAVLGMPPGPALDAELRDLFCGPATRLSP